VTPASRYSPAIDRHPVIGVPRIVGEEELMGGWAAAD
jgi:hypothetical protein